MVSYWENRRRKEQMAIEVQNTHKDIETIEKEGDKNIIERELKRRKKRENAKSNKFTSFF